jgi:hypothetical protein
MRATIGAFASGTSHCRAPLGVSAFIPRDVFERGGGITTPPKALNERRIPSESGDSREQSRMVARSIRGRKKDEEHVYGLPVYGSIIGALRANAEEYLGFADGGAYGVGDRDPVTDTGAEYLFPCKKGCQYPLA